MDNAEFGATLFWQAQVIRLSSMLASLRFYLLVGLATIGVLLISESAHIFTDALYNDDGWWVGIPFVGGDSNAPDGYRLFHEFIFAIGSTTGSVVLLRLLLVLSHAIAAILLARLLIEFRWRPSLAALISIAVLSLPIFLSQHFFVSASHSILALPFALSGILLLNSGAPLGCMRQVGCYCLGAIFIQLATWLSPIFTVFPILILLVPLVCWQQAIKHWLGVACYLAISSLVLYMLAQALLFSPHEYTLHEGWTEISITQPFVSLSGVLNIIWRRVIAGPLLVQYLLLVGVVMLLASVLMVFGRGLHKRSSSTQAGAVAGYRMAGLLLLCSAMSMAPVVFLTFVSDRYCFIPMVFGLSAVFVLLRQMMASEVPRGLAIPGLLLLIIGNTITASVAKANILVGFGDLHVEMAELLEVESSSWKADAQILVLVDSALEGNGPANGYIHFSTGYLRYVSGRKDITGLIGPVSAANGPVFAKTPDVFGEGDDYWHVVDGKHRRMVMVGLIADRPLYAYQKNSDGAFVRIEQMIFPEPDGGAQVASFGEEASRLPVESSLTFCDLNNNPTNLVWPTPPVPFADIVGNDPQMEWCEASFEGEYHFAGTDTSTITLSPTGGDFISLELDLVPTGNLQWNRAYSPVSPKMPILGDQIALYSLGPVLRIVDRSNDVSFARTARDKRSVRFIGIQGCRIDVYLNGDHLGMLSDKKLNGDLLMGKGFLQRQWSGSITVKYEQKRKDGCG